MAEYTTANIRNLVVVGHAASGKTTLVERILEVTKTIGRMGSVEDGNTVCDYEPEEKAHKHSLNSAIVHVSFNGTRINLIDTPGYPDFVGQGNAAIAAADAVCLVIDATRGIENMTRRMMRLAAEENLPRFIVINKMQLGKDNLEELLEQIRETFGRECLPINLPAGGASSIVRCFYRSADGGAADFSSIEDAHQALIDQVVEIDENLMERYLGGEELSPEELATAFKKAMCQGHLVPILFTSARHGTGVEVMLDVITRLCPSPADANARPFLVRTKDDAEEQEWLPSADPAKPLLGHAFRIAADPFVGKLAAFRIHQGTLRSGDSVSIGEHRKPVRLAHIFQLQGKDHVECHEAIPGDIVAVAKIDEMHYDAVVHGELGFASIRAKSIPQPTPMFGLAVTAVKRGEEGKISQALIRLAEEDPTFTFDRDATTHEMVMHGIGELHLRVVIERLKSRFNLEVNTAPPKIAYKETISVKAEGHHRHKKQTGGAGQFGEVYLRVEPLPTDSDEKFEFVDDTFGGSVPRQFLPAIEKGVRQVLQLGCVAGYPMQGIRVAVYDGKYHPVDSKEVAFITAGKRAFMDAVSKAKPRLLEPFVKLEVATPSDYMGDITSDLMGRRGRIQGTDMLAGGMAIITAEAPLAEVMSYAATLKAMTQGTGSYTMEYSHDEPTPNHIQAEVVAAYKPHAEED